MGLEPESAPDSTNRRMTQAAVFCHRARAPVCAPMRHGLQRFDHDLLNRVVCNFAWSPRPLLVEQARKPLVDEALAPLTYGFIGGAQFLGHLNVRYTFGTPEDDARTKRDMPVYAASPRKALQLVTLRIGELQCRFRSSCLAHVQL